MKEISKNQLIEFIGNKPESVGSATNPQILGDLDLKKGSSVLSEMNTLFTNINQIMNNDFIKGMINSKSVDNKVNQYMQQNPQIANNTQVVEPKLKSELEAEQPKQQEVIQVPQFSEEQKEEKAQHLYKTILSLLDMQIQMDEKATVKDLKHELESNEKAVCVQIKMIL